MTKATRLEVAQDALETLAGQEHWSEQQRRDIRDARIYTYEATKTYGKASKSFQRLALGKLVRAFAEDGAPDHGLDQTRAQTALLKAMNTLAGF